MSTYKLLTDGTGNPKIAKANGIDYLTAVLHLAPSDRAGRGNVCPMADSCAIGCLNTAGRGGIALDEHGENGIQRARIRRTRLYFDDRAAFMALLVADIDKLRRRAAKAGLRPAVRPNGTSDIRWETVPCIRDGIPYPSLMHAFPDVQFYDYTKIPNRRGIPANYHLTFSLSATNDRAAATALANGLNVAAVFAVKRGAPLPATFAHRPVIDGDLSDHRFLDPAGVIVGLRAKGPAIRDTSGFVRAGIDGGTLDMTAIVQPARWSALTTTATRKAV